MSSKQLNFFITHLEHEKINELIKKEEVAVILKKDITPTSEVSISEKLPIVEDDIFQVYFSSSEFLEKIVVLSTDDGKRYFDIDESYLLQFNLGGFYPYDKNFLQRGRFYYVKDYYNKQDVLEKKSNEFIEWCDHFIKEFRKEFLNKYPKGDIFLYSDSAIKWIEENNATLINGGQQWKAN
ncbi:hypothetical protein WH221_07975 [Chryseobacterium culicis]|uniref:Uncharacterized protein n=1 Tax=Chryseobacterium culicis TaxID=680127 RepID=A0A2S9D075_CHRCI|nr:hypothetical protein [Chryseobacterium culicis]PRB86173.1 hypothetical protein CQ022_07960 [Chryseobacterium culicis]PRB91926.1 hypothetical protein CQ033_01630 [Chryseobacterium culicis]